MGDKTPNKVEELTLEAAQQKLDAGALLLDVRNKDEWDAGHAPQARYLPLPRLREDPAAALGEIRFWLENRSPDATSSEVVVVCRSGQRSLKAAEILISHGIPASNLAGGMKAWAEAGLEMVAEGSDEPKVI